MGVMAISNMGFGLAQGTADGRLGSCRDGLEGRGGRRSARPAARQLPGWGGPLVECWSAAQAAPPWGRPERRGRRPARGRRRARLAGVIAGPAVVPGAGRSPAPVPRPARQAGASPWVIQGAPGKPRHRHRPCHRWQGEGSQKRPAQCRMRGAGRPAAPGRAPRRPAEVAMTRRTRGHGPVPGPGQGRRGTAAGHHR